MPQPIMDAFISPGTAAAATAAIRTRPNEVLAARGSNGETPMHWAVLCGVGLVSDLLSIGLDINAVDASGRTPLDWLNERLWRVVFERNYDLREGARISIRTYSIRILPSLLAMGARSGQSARIPEQMWSRLGLWDILLYRPDRDQKMLLVPQAWRGWGANGESVVHGWVLAPHIPEKLTALTHFLSLGLTVNETDIAGSTPLDYIVAASAARPHLARTLAQSAAVLASYGAKSKVKVDVVASTR